jgi:peptidoglycan/LPS O-acetylase OafA/YrhL
MSSMEAAMSSSEKKREDGSAMLAIGWVIILFALLVFFFHPAALKLGESRFAAIAACLAVAGLILALAGTKIRRQNR